MFGLKEELTETDGVFWIVDDANWRSLSALHGPDGKIASAEDAVRMSLLYFVFGNLGDRLIDRGVIPQDAIAYDSNLQGILNIGASDKTYPIRSKLYTPLQRY